MSTDATETSYWVHVNAERFDCRPAFDRLADYARRCMVHADTPGLALAITDRDSVIHVLNLGYADLGAARPVTPATLFEIGSIGKCFTAIMLAQLQAEGRLSLEQPMSEVLPWFHVQSAYASITVRHLLSHTAGIIVGTDMAADGRFEVYQLRETETGAAPGEVFYYSNVGYKALGYLVEELTGLPYSEAVRRRILETLGITTSDGAISHETRRRLAVGYQPFYDDRPWMPGDGLVPATWLETETGDGCLATTAEDLAVFLRMLLNHGQGPTSRILSESDFALLTEPVISVPETDGDQYALGLRVWSRDGTRFLGHGGDMVGYNSNMLGNVDDGFGAVTLINGPGYPRRITQYALDLLRAVIRSEPLPPAPELIDRHVVPEATDLAGTYIGEHGQFTMRAADCGARLDDGHDSFDIIKHSDDRYLVSASRFRRFPFVAEREPSSARIIGLRHGGRWFERTDAGATAFRRDQVKRVDTGHELHRCTGEYRCHNPWFPRFSVLYSERDGGPRLAWPSGDDEHLTPLAEGTYRIGSDEWLPERLRFDAFVDGYPLRAWINGQAYYRIGPH